MEFIIKNKSHPSMLFIFGFLFRVFLIHIVFSNLVFSNNTMSFRRRAAGAIKPTIAGGQWVLLKSSIGISAMHMQLLNNNRVIIFDRTDFGRSNISLPKGYCRRDPHDTVLKVDCTAHSVMYDIASNSVRPLTVLTDTWCSSGGVNPGGNLIQTGGYNDGDRKLRVFTPCEDDKCDWIALQENLTDRRWYATNQVLPDGRMIVMGGRLVFTYEFVPKQSIRGPHRSFFMPFLQQTRDSREENNLYPFLHLLPDGNLFVFANRRSILFNYINNRVIKEYPVIPTQARRNYPSSGSSVLLPLRLNSNGSAKQLPEAEVLICGGAPPGAFTLANKYRVFAEASNTCVRMKVTDPNPKWIIEVMPMPRVMGDMIILPTGDVIIVHGARNGTAGWEDAVEPVLTPVLYKTDQLDPRRRFQLLTPSKIPRMYHSSAVLLPDGRVLVGGSNPHRTYDFKVRPYPTDLSLEAYLPFYLNPQFSMKRPTLISVETRSKLLSYGKVFTVTFSLGTSPLASSLYGALVFPSFSTHSLAMNQRMVILDTVRLEGKSFQNKRITLHGPTSRSVAPPGYYMLYLVHDGIPSTAVWVQLH